MRFIWKREGRDVQKVDDGWDECKAEDQEWVLLVR